MMQEAAMKKPASGLIYLFCAFLFILSGCSAPVKQVNADADGVAIKGYDPVAYFTLEAPAKGTHEFQLEWHGARWRFSSREHLELFRETPGKYAPQYGGYCAYAVSQGSTADIDPEAWAIVDGKLYLNLNKDVQTLWDKDRAGYIKMADKNWPELLK
jgi:YHS domain-containing protein